MTDRYKSVCQWCGKAGMYSYGALTGKFPDSAPFVPGKCPSHPSGKPNMPHKTKWEKA